MYVLKNIKKDPSLRLGSLARFEGLEPPTYGLEECLKICIFNYLIAVDNI